MSKTGSGLLDKVDANPHPHGRMIGYARVSMADQSNNRQVADPQHLSVAGTPQSCGMG